MGAELTSLALLERVATALGEPMMHATERTTFAVDLSLAFALALGVGGGTAGGVPLPKAFRAFALAAFALRVILSGLDPWVGDRAGSNGLRPLVLLAGDAGLAIPSLAVLVNTLSMESDKKS